MYPAGICAITYPDEGKSCRKADDCMSKFCVAFGPKPTEGKCHGWRPHGGTYRYFDKDGKVVEISIN
jgi:hypothetical protein